jgi:ABC-type lipoprotein export system ATPase subunit
MLKTKNITYAYTQNQTFCFPDMNCGAAEQWLLLGQSGCGKTTLLHLLAGLLAPKEGEIYVADQNIGQFRRSELDTFRGKHIGIVFQQAHFIQSLSVKQNLRLAQSLANLPTDNRSILTLLDRLHLGHKANELPHRLSIGEQQRVSIARALINRPAIVLADEPTSALDDQNAAEVTHLLEEQTREQGATLLIVTHDQRLKSRFSNQILLATP